MNFQTVKKTTAKGVMLNHVSIEWEWHDGSLHGLTLTDDTGRILRLTSTYGLSALTLAPPEKKTVHVVKGTVRAANTPIREEFEEQYEADQRARELTSADVVEGAVTVEKEEIEIPF